MSRSLPHTLLGLATWLLAASAAAAPLSLSELDALERHLLADEPCRLLPAYQRPACRAERAVTPPNPAWEKDGVPGLSREDLVLARAEYWDEGTLQYICYEEQPAGQVVRFSEQCDTDRCLAQRGATCQRRCQEEAEAPGEVDAGPGDEAGAACDCGAERLARDCTDADGDGLFAYQEQALGLSDDHADTCTTDRSCGFHETCRYLEGATSFAVRPVCQPRDCGEGGCLAFHLEAVSQNADELILRAHFDHAPVPPTVLDLYLEFDARHLRLSDARPLRTLREGQRLEARQVQPGALRLMVFGMDSKAPIQPGPFAELVFQRLSQAAAQVAFSSVKHRRRMSMAPYPGALGSDELEDDALWGEPVRVAASDDDSPRMVLHYTFDDSRRPLALRRAPTGAELCPSQGPCLAKLGGASAAAPTDDAGRRELAQRIDALQQGAVDIHRAVDGVSGAGAFLDGYANHLELPLTFAPDDETRDFSLSTWFYIEPDERRSFSGPQLLFSHNTSAERTQYAVTLEPGDDGGFQLVWTEGAFDAPSPSRPPVKMFQPLLPGTWHHFALAIAEHSPETGAPTARMYLDGEAAEAVPLAEAPRCPQVADGQLLLHELGAITGGTVPESLFFASAQNNLFGIERMNLDGLDRETLVRAPDSAAKHPHYSPITGKLVFASSASGSYEIWIANADGTEPVQVTRGFGDSARGVAAGHPRWAPDGSAIVFESNVYSLPDDDNAFARRAHLYYLAYDLDAGAVSVPLPGGQTVSQLDYGRLLSLGVVQDYRLTRLAQGHRGARWLRGASREEGREDRGELIFNTVSKDGKRHALARLRITAPVNEIETVPLDPFAGQRAEGELEADVRVLAAGTRRPRRDDPGVPLTLLQKQWVRYTEHPDVSLTLEPEGERFVATLRYTPATDTLGATCWDVNRDKVCNLGTDQEDRDGSGACDRRDCLPSELTDLYVAFNDSELTPVLDAKGRVAVEPGEAAGARKSLRGTPLSGDRAYVKLEVLSPADATPLSPGATLARVRFARRDELAGGPWARAERRQVRQALFLARGDAAPQPFDTSGLSQVLAADFSPDGARVALSAITQSRPVILTQATEGATLDRRVLSSRPVLVQGLDWAKRERLYPCHWLGAYRDRGTGRYRAGLRGGLDELKLYNYARSAEAFRSEYERGHERLAVRAGGDQTQSGEGRCEADLDCPPYQLCGADKRCAAVPCDPDDAYPCERGKCTLRPIPSGGVGQDWVCAVECEGDVQCFSQQCLNGPCRFCSPTTRSCQECRPVVQDLGGVTVDTIEGCPDRNSFACVEGSCLTECYSFANEQSTYLCDPLLEYCAQGKCTSFDWSWSDLSPVTLAGGGEMRNDLPHRFVTRAISQLYAVELEAFGAADYGVSPELVVEARVDTPDVAPYPGWFSVGRVQVHHRRPTDARRAPYVLQVPHPITKLRVRLAKDSYRAKEGSPLGPAALGSRPLLGYPAQIGWLESAQACQGEQGCVPLGSDPRLAYVRSGQPAVVITALRVHGQPLLGPQTEHNYACAYAKAEDGGASREPLDARGLPRTVLRPTGAGRLLNYACVDQACAAKRDWALLNCSQQDAGGQVAELLARVPPAFSALGKGVLRVGSVQETKSSCFVEVDPTRTELCYEWLGGGPALDAFAAPAEANRTLDYDTFRGFGYDAAPHVTP